MTVKERLAIEPQAMPEQDPVLRARNMDEVALGYTAQAAMREAERCLNCPAKPCVAGCPVKLRIPDFISAVAKGDFAAALAIIRENSLLPAVCGRVCPQERQCQKHCTVGRLLGDVSKAVAIGRIERFVADNAVDSAEIPAVAPTGRRVAVVGTGPASITCAADCARAGHEVVMFEAFHKPGGVLVYGIPEFRLPKRIVEREIETLERMGVKIVTDFIVSRTRRLEDLRCEYDAVFIGSGAGTPKFMGIEGEDLVGVFSANEYLTRANLMKAYQEEKAATPYWHGAKVAVLGGGNVAMDASRMALRLGAREVHLIYRRSEREMPARAEEIQHAKEEGVIFHMLENASRIIGDENGFVNAVECHRCELTEPDASGRRRSVPVKGSEFILPVDTVIVAIGSGQNPLITSAVPGLKVDGRGRIAVDGETMETSLPGVFAGGDIVQGAATVILAMGDGRRAAAAINSYLAGR
jgi:glutamate synthase (NADPH/NADH) small chain